MNFPFNANQGLAIVEVELTGPSGSAILRLALDTGATKSLINAAPLVALGYDPALSPHRMQVTTGNGVEFVPSITLMQLKALGGTRIDFPVLFSRGQGHAGIP
jgi:hypothetical protein